MTFEKFFDDVWRIQKHHVLLFEERDSNVVEVWADENEDGLWKDIPAITIVAIDTRHTGMCASEFLAEKWLKAEVKSIIILSGCICVFLAPQDEASPTGADKEYEAKIITHGNCMICGKELDEGLFFCKECKEKAERSE